VEKVLVSGLNEADAGVRLEFAIARAEVASRSVNIASAALYSAIEATLREARECPELSLGAAVHHVSMVRVPGLRAAQLRRRAPSVWGVPGWGGVGRQRDRHGGVGGDVAVRGGVHRVR
jgi:hypothetical protein